MQAIQKILTEKNIRSHRNEGILICRVDNATSGLELAKDILSAIVDKKTVVYLSGGKTPKELYRFLSVDLRLHPGGVGMVDERYGDKLHEKSNEKMLKDSGLLRYLDYNDIPFYPILQNPRRHPRPSVIPAKAGIRVNSSEDQILDQVENDNKREDTAQLYDDKLRSLLSVFQKHIAVLGIGLDGHTAGIAGNRPDFTNPLFEPSQKSLLVSEFNDEKGIFKQRITMTFLGLSHMDFLLVLVFGEDKQKALEVMFSPGSEKDIPSRFFKRPEIAKKTVLITDQNI